jgi:hypothetical protein
VFILFHCRESFTTQAANRIDILVGIISKRCRDTLLLQRIQCSEIGLESAGGRVGNVAFIAVGSKTNQRNDRAFCKQHGNLLKPRGAGTSLVTLFLVMEKLGTFVRYENIMSTVYSFTRNTDGGSKMSAFDFV